MFFNGVSIFTKSGVVLWSYDVVKLKDTNMLSINRLIRTVLLQERSGNSMTAEILNMSLKWRLINELNLVMVVIYQGLHDVFMIDKLLDAMKTDFVAFVGANNIVALQHTPAPVEYDKRFMKLLNKLENNSANINKNNKNDNNRNGETNNECVKRVSHVHSLQRGKDDEDNEGGKDTKLNHKRSWNTQKVTKQNMDALDYSDKISNEKQAAREKEMFGAGNSLSDSEDEENEG